MTEKQTVLATLMIPTNTPRVFHVETTWKWSFPRRFNVEYTGSVCRDILKLAKEKCEKLYDKNQLPKLPLLTF